LNEARTEDDLRAIWQPLADRLDTLAQAEEEIYYPALLKKLSMRWLRFYWPHPTADKIDAAPRDPAAFIEDRS
jgi:hypothetical protein